MLDFEKQIEVSQITKEEKRSLSGLGGMFWCLSIIFIIKSKTCTVTLKSVMICPHLSFWPIFTLFLATVASLYHKLTKLVPASRPLLDSPRPPPNLELSFPPFKSLIKYHYLREALPDYTSNNTLLYHYLPLSFIYFLIFMALSLLGITYLVAF